MCCHHRGGRDRRDVDVAMLGSRSYTHPPSTLGLQNGGWASDPAGLKKLATEKGNQRFSYILRRRHGQDSCPDSKKGKNDGFSPTTKNLLASPGSIYCRRHAHSLPIHCAANSVANNRSFFEAGANDKRASIVRITMSPYQNVRWALSFPKRHCSRTGEGVIGRKINN